MKTTTCKRCNQPFNYKPVSYMWFPPPYCSTCWEAFNREAKAEQEAERLHELNRQWGDICPKEYRDTDPMKLPQQRPLQTVLAWRYGPKGLIAHGETGHGKTRAVFQLLHRLHFDENRKIVCFGATEFGDECGKRFFDGDGVDWIRRLAGADVLFLDDLGREKVTERVESALFGLVEKRTANQKPIIITTNCVGDSLASKFAGGSGQPLVRRLREFCQDVVF